MSEVYRKGLEEIANADPESGPAFVEELKKVSPDFAEFFSVLPSEKSMLDKYSIQK